MSRRSSGGRFDFVDGDDLSHLDDKLGKHAPPMGGHKPHRVFESYERPSVVETSVTGKVEEFFRRIKNWLRGRSHHHRFRSHQALKNLIGFSALFILALAVYANVESLNEKPFLFLRIGSAALIVLVIGSLVFLKRLLVNLKYGYEGGRNAVKLVFFLVLFVLAVGIYFNQETVFTTLKGEYEGINFDKFNPLVLSYADIGKKAQETSEDFGSYIEEATAPPDIDTIELIVFEKVNAVRTGQDKKALEWEADLGLLARTHSEDMAERDFFDHVNPDGEDPTDRARRLGVASGGIHYIGIAENITTIPTGDVIGCGQVYDEESIADCAVSGWITSPGHYQNMIDSWYRMTGVGVAYDGYQYLITQNFRG